MHSINRISLTLSVVLFSALLGACTPGSKMLKEPLPLAIEEPLVHSADETITASLDWIIVPGGPGTWAKNAYWDEYLISVQPLITETIEINQIRVVDALDTGHAAMTERRHLVAATKSTMRRYSDAGIDPAAAHPMDTAGKVGAGAVGFGVVTGAGAGMALTGLGAGYGIVGATAASGAIVFGAPVLAVGGIVRSGNNNRVNKEIQARMADLPLTLTDNENVQLSVFVPVTPLPQRVEIDYRVGDLPATLALGLDALTVLHVSSDEDGSLEE